MNPVMPTRTQCLIAVSMVFLSFAGCQDMGIDDQTGIVVPGMWMDGIPLGASKESVVARLGQPTREWLNDVGAANPLLYCYYGEDADMRFMFVFISPDGPLDWMRAGPAYTGRTTEGIGIGSTRALVLQTYGLPVYSSSLGRYLTDYYCMRGRTFHLDYADSVVLAMTMGYFVSNPLSSQVSCN